MHRRQAIKAAVHDALSVLRAVNGILLFYAMLVVAAVWAYAALHIRSDKTQILDAERNRLRGVTAALKADSLETLAD
jgi:hypothetical protein